MTKTWCVGGKHYNNTNIIIEYEKINPKTKKFVKITKGICSVCGRDKSQIFTKYLTRGQDFINKGRFKINTVRLCQIQHGVT